MGHTIRLLMFVAMLVVALDASAQNRVKVSGHITDKSTSAPLPGATITWGKAQGTSANIDGYYTINVEEGTTITFSFIGYSSLEWQVPMGTTQTTFDAQLTEEANTVDEVVVVAYGTRKKGTIAGSVSTVKAEKLESEKEVEALREQIYNDYIKRAKERIEKNIAVDQAQADERLAAYKKHVDETKESMRKLCDEKKEEWVGEIVKRALS